MSPAERPRLEWIGTDEFRLAGASFDCRPVADGTQSTPERFCIRKPREVIEKYEELIDDLRPLSIFEVGIFEGGSTAMLAEVAPEAKLVAIDIEARPNDALRTFLSDRGHAHRVKTYWGTDQADRNRLNSIVEDEFKSSLDLVLDDASHFLAESRRTFEALFPRLRPGGVYVLEDWSWPHGPIELWETRAPLSVLTAEIALMSARRPELVSSVEITRPWTLVRRGVEPLEPGSFDTADLLGGRGRRMIGAMEVAGTQVPHRSRIPWRRPK